MKLDVHRHVLWERTRILSWILFEKQSVFSNLDSKNETIEGQIQTLFDELVSRGSKLSSEISGNPYEYYYNVGKGLFQIILQDQARLDILEADISLAQQNNPNAQQLTVNLKFSAGDALVIYVKYNLDYQYAFPTQSESMDSDKSYKIYIALS